MSNCLHHKIDPTARADHSATARPEDRLDANGVCVECGLQVEIILIPTVLNYGAPRNMINSSGYKIVTNHIFNLLKNKIGYILPDKLLYLITSTYNRLTGNNIMKTRNRLVYLYIAVNLSLQISQNKALDMVRFILN